MKKKYSTKYSSAKYRGDKLSWGEKDLLKAQEARKRRKGTKSEIPDNVKYWHLSTKGYGLFAFVIMAGLFVVCIPLFKVPIIKFFAIPLFLYGILWVFKRVPDAMVDWERLEKYNPETKKYRGDKF